ncbi:right-handed parallel beta-helix repeat-containing protein [Geminicoccus roseus]|uniref:right-handed parallel beta-helix repeat-containing protein n=1 Tax=Geminicoccus roseus TaxID=404900 RepID=UPI00146FA7BC|nr:right-handed parallel beta-helix repeat-containing protein [Geminicoccus roseus]
MTGANRLDGSLVKTSTPQIWRVELSTGPTQVFIDNGRGRRVISVAACTTYRDWCWTSGTLTVRGKDSGTRPLVEASVRDIVLNTNGFPGIRIEGLRLERARRHCVVLGAAQAPVIRNCEIVEAFQNGIEFGTEHTHDNGLIEANLVSEHGQTGINGGGRMNGWTIRGNQVIGCGRIHNEMVGADPGHQWTAGIKIWGWAASGIQGGLLIEGNSVADCRIHAWAPENQAPHNHGCGIWIDEVFAPRAPQVVRANRIANCQSRGIFIEKSDDCVVQSNSIDSCGKALYTGGISVQGNNGRGAARNTIEHNTVRGGWWAAEIGGQSVTAFDDNIVRNNIFYGSPNQQLYVVGGGANLSGKGKGNLYYSNCTGPERTNFLTWEQLYDTIADFQAASGGKAYGNQGGDPRFASTALGNMSLASDSICLGAATDGGHIGAWQG